MDRRVRYIIAILAAGVAGFLVNSIAGALMLDGIGFLDLLLNPVRLLVAVLVAAMLPYIHIKLPTFVEDVVSLIALTIVPSCLAKWVFGVPHEWSLVIILHAIYAAVALMVYRLVAEWGREEHD